MRDELARRYREISGQLPPAAFNCSTASQTISYALPFAACPEPPMPLVQGEPIDALVREADISFVYAKFCYAVDDPVTNPSVELLGGSMN